MIPQITPRLFPTICPGDDRPLAALRSRTLPPTGVGSPSGGPVSGPGCGFVLDNGSNNRLLLGDIMDIVTITNQGAVKKAMEAGAEFEIQFSHNIIVHSSAKTARADIVIQKLEDLGFKPGTDYSMVDRQFERGPFLIRPLKKG